MSRYGLRHYGALTCKVFSVFADVVAEIDHMESPFTTLKADASLQDQLPHYAAMWTYDGLAPSAVGSITVPRAMSTGRTSWTAGPHSGLPGRVRNGGDLE